jgi:hypothetical protein
VSLLGVETAPTLGECATRALRLNALDPVTEPANDPDQEAHD